MAKKPHWTQTPEGKAKIKARYAKRAKRNQGESHGTPEEKEALVVAYAAGRVEQWLLTFAYRSGVAPRLLAKRVGEFLLNKTDWQGMGA
jgi:hypothetical protein